MKAGHVCPAFFVSQVDMFFYIIEFELKMTTPIWFMILLSLVPV